MVTGIAELIFHNKAEGSLIFKNGKVVGSELIGQQFDRPDYFIGRPSAINYNPLPSGGSNLGLLSDKLRDQVIERRKQFIKFNQLDTMLNIPSEMLFASASGLDPHISRKATMLQVDRIVKARNFDAVKKTHLVKMIDSLTERPQFMLLGEERVNINLLNLMLDKFEK